MKRIRRVLAKAGILTVGFFLLFSKQVLATDHEEKTDKRQIVFLLDASKSMQKDGLWMEAADSACMIATALSEEYESALLVYIQKLFIRRSLVMSIRKPDTLLRR